MTTNLTAGTRIRVHRTAGRRTVFLKTGTVLGVAANGVIHFQCSTGSRVHLATSAQLAPMGQAQTVTVLADAPRQVALAS
jgi:hypothetical protein